MGTSVYFLIQPVSKHFKNGMTFLSVTYKFLIIKLSLPISLSLYLILKCHIIYVFYSSIVDHHHFIQMFSQNMCYSPKYWALGVKQLCFSPFMYRIYTKQIFTVSNWCITHILEICTGRKIHSNIQEILKVV